MAGKLTLILGVIKVVVGVIIVGLGAKVYHDTSSLAVGDGTKANSFGPVLCGLLIIVAGIFGILADIKAGKWDVLYLIGATVAACCGAGVLWISSASYEDYCDNDYWVSFCSSEYKGILIGLILCGLIAFIIGLVGLVMTALRACNRTTKA